MKEVREMLRLATELGWTPRRMKNGYRLLHPSGATTMVHTSCSDHRAKKNLLADLHRPGKMTLCKD